MVLVRMVFQCKLGKAGEVAQMMREGAAALAEVLGAREVRILTDLSGPFDRVVQEVEVESLAEWEAARNRVFSHPEFLKNREREAGMIESGYHEFYTLEYTR